MEPGLWSRRFTMPSPIQTNKEFVEAAGIAERDAFLAVAIRRAVARMVRLPARELTAEMTFDMVTRDAWDWDTVVFAMELEQLFNIDICDAEWEKGEVAADAAGYSNWFYSVDKFGEWVKLCVEIVLAPMRDKITPPDDWPGLEASDLESDTVVAKSAMDCCMVWGLGIVIVTIIAIVLFQNLFR